MAFDFCVDRFEATWNDIVVFDAIENGTIILLNQTDCIIIATVVQVEYKAVIFSELPSLRTSIKDTSDLQLDEAARAQMCIRGCDNCDDF